jgi:hypothetical protein
MYIQIAEAILKKMRKAKETNFYSFISQFELTDRIAGYYKNILTLKLDLDLPQRTKVALGKIIARLVTAEFTLGLLDTGFRADLVDNAIQVVGNTIAEQVSSISQFRPIHVIEEYQEGSDWKASY